MAKSQRVTLTSIAKALNVSIGTVDRALHDRPDINEKTKQRVLQKAKELNYQANSMAQVLSRRNTIRIGVVLPCRSSVMRFFWDEAEAGIRHAANKLIDSKVEINICRPNGFDVGSQVILLRQLIESEVDGIIVCPFENDLVTDILKTAVERGIYVITVGNDVDESARSSYITAGSETIGKMAGECMAKILNENGNVLVFLGFYSFGDNQKKLDGFLAGLREFAPNIRVLEVVETKENDALAYEETIRCFQKYDQISGIYVNTANSIGVCSALKDLGKSKSTRLVTSDVFLELTQYIEDGTIDATIFQNPFMQGSGAVDLMYQYITTKTVAHSVVPVKPELVIKSNLQFYFSKNVSLQTVSDITAGWRIAHNSDPTQTSTVCR